MFSHMQQHFYEFYTSPHASSSSRSTWGTNLLSFHPSQPRIPIAAQTMTAPPNVKAVIAVPAAPGMKNEQKRVRGMVRDRPIVATGC